MKGKTMCSHKKNSGGMIDVTGKKITKRMACACAVVRMSKRAVSCLAVDANPKGDVLNAARIAGVMGAKETPRIIPYCHPLSLNKVNIRFEIDENASIITVFADVTAHGRTGVEMEALTAVSSAALTIYDMLKWTDKGIVISDIQLLKKTGGASGKYVKRMGT